MKKIKLILLSLCCILLSKVSFGQDSKSDTIKVYGNCSMCKATIEGSLKKKDGVLSKNWNKDTKMLVITYDPSKITIQEIGEKVAGAGYDNQYATASNQAYFNLHTCCHYERPKQSK